MLKEITREERLIQTPLENADELIRFFRKKSKLIIFDIGSCDGLDSIRYAKLFPNSKIYAFEPLRKNIQLINENIKKFNCSNILPFELALSDKNGVSEFFISSGRPENIDEKDTWNYGNKSSSLLSPEKHLEIHPFIKFNEKVFVNTQTLYDFCEKELINIIDFVHLDVQGAELMVLTGAKEKIRAIKMIWLEVENIELYKNQPLKKDIELFMSHNGFTIIKSTVNHISGDQLWVNYRFFKKSITHNFWLLFFKIKNLLNL